MAYRVIFLSSARDDAVQAAAYIAEHASPETANLWLDALAAAVESLEEFPSRCPLARESGAFPGVELRELLFTPYRLIFTVRSGTVYVLHVRHSAMRSLDEL